MSESGFAGFKDWQDLCQALNLRLRDTPPACPYTENHANPLILKIRVRTSGEASARIVFKQG